MRGKGFLAEIEIGDFGFRLQDTSSRSVGALLAFGQVLAGFIDGPVAFLAAFLELPHAGLEIPQPFFTLGQFYFDFGGLAGGGYAATFQPVDLLAKPRQ